MQRFETRFGQQVPAEDLGLDLSPPVRLDLWALLLALGIVAGVAAPPVAMAFVLASAVVSVGAALRHDASPTTGRRGRRGGRPGVVTNTSHHARREEALVAGAASYAGEPSAACSLQVLRSAGFQDRVGLELPAGEVGEKGGRA